MTTPSFILSFNTNLDKETDLFNEIISSFAVVNVFYFKVKWILIEIIYEAFFKKQNYLCNLHFNWYLSGENSSPT